MSVFISCGEVSGDLYAADLIQHLLKQEPALQGKIWGMLGPKSCNAGGEALWSYEELQLMGIIEVLPAIPRILKLRNAIVKEIFKRKPDTVVVVDSPDFHFSLVKKLRRMGYKGNTVFLVTPTVWAWRSGRTELLKKYFDLSLPLFAFEHHYLRERNVNSLWKAHPLATSLLTRQPIPQELQERIQGQRTIALMPGSRKYDIRFHLQHLIEAAHLLKEKGFYPVFSIAPGLPENLRQEVKDRTRAFGNWAGEGRELMAASEAVAGVSGTVAVESMLLERFMVVIYNGRGLSWLLAKALVRIPYISIPNYLTEQPVYPELLKEQITPARICKELLTYLENPHLKAETDQRLKKARQAMGTDEAGAFWAQAILELKAKTLR